MLNLNTNLTLDKKSEKLKEVFTENCNACDGWGNLERNSNCWKCMGTGKTPKDKITIADVIDNRRTLFNGDYNLVVNEIFKMYLKGKPLKDIEIYILSNLK